LTEVSRDKKLLNKFFKSILSPKEYQEIASRLQIFKLTLQDYSQRYIAKKLKVGLATASRGAREAKKENKLFKKIFVFIIFAFLFFPFRFIFAQAEGTGSVIINEIMYDLPDADTGREWIEVKNVGESDVDFSQWKFFENETNHGLSIFQGNSILIAGGLGIVADDPEKFLIDWSNFAGTIFDSSFSLSNTGEVLALKDENLNVVNEFNYNSDLGAKGDGNSLYRLSDNNFQAKSPTPGTEIIIDSEETTEDITDEEDIENAEDTENTETEDIIENSEPPKVFINEINWTGGAGNAYGEWIELYCDCENEADLANWGIYNGDDKLIISLTKKIEAKGYYLIARTTASHQNELENIADEVGQFGSGGLSNSGEMLILKDSLGNIIQSFDFRNGWPAGDNETKETMQWDGTTWFTSSGTPKAENIKVVGEAENNTTENNTINNNTNTNSSSGVGGGGIVSIPNTTNLVIKPIKKPEIITSKEIKVYLNLNDSSLTLVNKSKKDLDLSNLKLESDGKIFRIPKNTILLKGGEIIASLNMFGFNQNTDLVLVGADGEVITDASFFN